MTGVIITFIVISLVASVVCYLTTSSFLFAAIVLILFIGSLFLLQYKKFKTYFSSVRRVHSSYFFINAYVVSLSVKESHEDAFESATRIQDPELNAFCSSLDNLSSYEKTKYLRTYFKLALYKMFLNILEIYQEQGGNILTMSENVLRESTRLEKTVTESSSIGIKHIVEFILLWGMSFGVLLFMKFGLTDFYQKMLSDPIFVPLIFIYFLICLASIHLFLNNFLNLTIKEDTCE